MQVVSARSAELDARVFSDLVCSTQLSGALLAEKLEARHVERDPFNTVALAHRDLEDVGIGDSGLREAVDFGAIVEAVLAAFLDNLRVLWAAKHDETVVPRRRVPRPRRVLVRGPAVAIVWVVRSRGGQDEAALEGSPCTQREE